MTSILQIIAQHEDDLAACHEWLNGIGLKFDPECRDFMWFLVDQKEKNLHAARNSLVRGRPQ